MKFNKKMICLLCVATITTSSLTMFGCHSKDDNGSSSSSSSSSSQSENKTDNKSEIIAGQLRLKFSADEKQALSPMLTDVDDKGHLLISLIMNCMFYRTDDYQKAFKKYEASDKKSDKEMEENKYKIIEESKKNSSSSIAEEQKEMEYPKDFCDRYLEMYDCPSDFPKEYSLSNYTKNNGLVSTEKTDFDIVYNFEPRKTNTRDFKTVANLIFVSEDEYNQAQKSGDKFRDDSGNVYDKKLAQGNGLVCLANFDIPNITLDDINADGKAMYEKLKQYIENSDSNGIARIENLENTKNYYIKQIDDQIDIGNQMPSFEAEATDGGTVSNKDFANHDLTMINIWQENCVPCVAELPDLERLSKEVSSNVQVMGMLLYADNDKSKESIRNILKKAGTSYKQFFANKQLESISSQILGTPTTIFVDKNGNMVGDPVVGTMGIDGYKKIIEERLNQIKN